MGRQPPKRRRGRPTATPAAPVQRAPASNPPVSLSSANQVARSSRNLSTRLSGVATHSTLLQETKRDDAESVMPPESEDDEDYTGSARPYPNDDDQIQSDEDHANERRAPILRSASNSTRSTPPSAAAPSIFQATEVPPTGSSAREARDRRTSSLLGPAQLPLARPSPPDGHSPIISSTLLSLQPELLAQLLLNSTTASQQASPALSTISLSSSRTGPPSRSVPDVMQPPLSGQKRAQSTIENEDQDATRAQRRREKKKKYNDARPRRSDYDTDATLSRALELAITYMKVETSTVDPYPDKNRRTEKSNEFFSQALTELGISSDTYVLDMQQLRLVSRIREKFNVDQNCFQIRAEDGNLRSAIQKAVDPLVASHYGLVAGPTPQQAEGTNRLWPAY